MFFSIVEVAIAYVYFLESMINDTVDSWLVFGTESPIFGKVIPDAVRNHAKCDIVFILCIG